VSSPEDFERARRELHDAVEEEAASFLELLSSEDSRTSTNLVLERSQAMWVYDSGVEQPLSTMDILEMVDPELYARANRLTGVLNGLGDCLMRYSLTTCRPSSLRPTGCTFIQYVIGEEVFPAGNFGYRTHEQWFAELKLVDPLYYGTHNGDRSKLTIGSAIPLHMLGEFEIMALKGEPVFRNT
jgi:hypothetical protein